MSFKNESSRWIKRILVGNRGLSAHKFLMSLREMMTEQRIDIEIFGISTPDDIKSRFKYINLLDNVIYCENNNVYTNKQKLIDMCKQHYIEAFWPGWGYLSEDYDFVKMLEENGITFIGPSSDSIYALGNKIKCMEYADSLDLPILPWGKVAPTDDFETSHKPLIDKIGFPLIVKDPDNGGGKGIYIVNDEEEYISNLYHFKIKNIPEIILM